MISVTCAAPVNIAVIKYWGKKDEKLILPTNDSISATLHTEQLCATTTVMISPDFKEDKIWLNGREEDIRNPRIQNCLSEVKKRSAISGEAINWKIHICSENNFPTAAGLASSAAGYACLAMALAKLYKVQGDISPIARIGSGSACRSTVGGFVRWYMGSDVSGSDSLAKQIVPAHHWPEMRIIILVVNDQKKEVSSSIGMKRSVETSDLFKYRIEQVVPKRTEQMHRAIVEKDFKTFAELTMKDSNQLHAICLDSYPPYFYLNDVSLDIIKLVHSYNVACGDIKVAYTFDAGPNATLYLLEKDVAQVISVIDHFFPPSHSNMNEYRKGLPIQNVEPSQELIQNIALKKREVGSLKYMIHTSVGNGPKYFDDPQNSLLDNNGWPIKATN